MITFIEHDDYNKHKMPQILESPRRLKVIKKALTEKGIYDLPDVKKLSPEPVTIQELRSIHTEQLIDTVKHGSMVGVTSITGDTITNEYTFQTARRAVGGTKLAADIVNKSPGTMAFAFVRPPGHHATKTKAMGFCFFNNVAYTANYLSTQKKVKRIAIIDFDGHYGNGTADIFYDRSDILPISLHSDPSICFPYQGRVTEIGEKEGEGYNICIPLPSDTGDQEYLQIFDEFIPTIIRNYKPEFILVSAGFDGLKKDPYGFLGLSPFGFQSISERIKTLANEVCQGKVAYSLEGGYKFDELGDAVLACISPYIKDYEFSQEPTKNWNSGGNKNQLKETSVELRKELKPYWKLD
ncbi:MAG: histone deacetylase family protein [Candidatus Heimdallarchaeota archaeon]